MPSLQQEHVQYQACQRIFHLQVLLVLFLLRADPKRSVSRTSIDRSYTTKTTKLYPIDRSQESYRDGFVKSFVVMFALALGRPVLHSCKPQGQISDSVRHIRWKPHRASHNILQDTRRHERTSGQAENQRIRRKTTACRLHSTTKGFRRQLIQERKAETACCNRRCCKRPRYSGDNSHNKLRYPAGRISLFSQNWTDCQNGARGNGDNSCRLWRTDRFQQYKSLDKNQN